MPGYIVTKKDPIFGITYHRIIEVGSKGLSIYRKNRQLRRFISYSSVIGLEELPSSNLPLLDKHSQGFLARSLILTFFDAAHGLSRTLTFSDPTSRESFLRELDINQPGKVARLRHTNVFSTFSDCKKELDEEIRTGMLSATSKEDMGSTSANQRNTESCAPNCERFVTDLIHLQALVTTLDTCVTNLCSNQTVVYAASVTNLSRKFLEKAAPIFRAYGLSFPEQEEALSANKSPS